ncbi:hypothetical protein AMK59_1642 [Oryctes borbonicus]|uniref:Uncharacterized protein n=1 Tax=Oryctes borbonicus TaxID=1629725 RepID=A0A0T6BC73_9SCAR|nr:hypothetical protein AMK59_1642 [Oryctes borbonicus]
MRVCFDTFCFSSWLHAADEEATQGLDPSNANSTATIASNDLLAPNTGGNHIMATTTISVDELQKKVHELEELLRIRDEEIVELRSHIDKFQSVFPLHFHVNARHFGLNNNVRARPRKQRAGISAEPHNASSIQELSEQTLPLFDKDER